MITTLGAGNRTETKNMKTQIEEIWYDGGGYPDAANVTVTQGRGYAEIWLHMEHTHARVGDEVILEADLGDGGSTNFSDDVLESAYDHARTALGKELRQDCKMGLVS